MKYIINSLLFFFIITTSAIAEDNVTEVINETAVTEDNTTEVVKETAITKDNVTSEKKETTTERDINDIEKEAKKKVNAEKGYKIYVEEELYVDTYYIPKDNFVYLMAYAGVGGGVAYTNNFNQSPNLNVGASAGLTFLNHLGVELNLTYGSTDYDDNSFGNYRYSQSYRNRLSSDQLNLKLYLTGNLPIDFEKSKLVPYIAVGGAVNFSTLYWYETSFSELSVNYYSKNRSNDISVGPTAKIGARYMYKGVVFEINVEYLYSYHNNVRKQNLSYIVGNFGIGFVF